MDIYTATEVAYKNGYEAGQRAAIDKVLNELEYEITNHSVYWSDQSRQSLLNRVAEFKERYKEM